VSKKIYYCIKCRHNHRFSSKIGKKHLQYKKSSQDTNGKSSDNLINVQPDDPEQTSLIIKDKSRLSEFIQDYRRSYRNGVEKFGFWWTVFQFSLWSLVLIFILTAVIIFVFYLPKVEMLLWGLE
jgi:hypothetical protein